MNATPEKKYPGAILAIDKAYILDDLNFQPGINTLGLSYFLSGLVKGDREKYPTGKTTDLASRLSVRERHFLETSPDFVQPLNYILLKKNVLTSMGSDHYEYEPQYSTYYRKKGVGESRLEDKMSVGWGGHTEHLTVFWKADSSIDYIATAMANILTELNEELKFEIDGTCQELDVSYSMDKHMQFKGFIWDPSDKVGQHHLAVLWELTIPEHVSVSSREHVQLFGPWVNKSELAEMQKQNGGQYFENWSNIVINAILTDVDTEVSWDEISLSPSKTSYWTDVEVLEHAGRWIQSPNREAEQQTAEAKTGGMADDDRELASRQWEDEVSPSEVIPGFQSVFDAEKQLTNPEQVVGLSRALMGLPGDDPQPGDERIHNEANFAGRFNEWATEAGWNLTQIASVFGKMLRDTFLRDAITSAAREAFIFKDEVVRVRLGAIDFIYTYSTELESRYRQIITSEAAIFDPALNNKVIFRAAISGQIADELLKSPPTELESEQPDAGSRSGAQLAWSRAGAEATKLQLQQAIFTDQFRALAKPYGWDDAAVNEVVHGLLLDPTHCLPVYEAKSDVFTFTQKAVRIALPEMNWSKIFRPRSLSQMTDPVPVDTEQLPTKQEPEDDTLGRIDRALRE